MGRAQITLLEPGTLEAAALAPAVFWLGLAALPRPAAAGLAALYAAAAVVETLRLAASDAAAALRLPALFALGHFCYAAGLLLGLAKAPWERGAAQTAPEAAS